MSDGPHADDAWSQGDDEESSPDFEDDHDYEKCFDVEDEMDEERAANHHCHAVGCETHCKPEHLMCFAHWRMVPDIIQRAVYRYYRPGQCDDMRPSENWHRAADAAIAAVAVIEMKPVRQKQLAELLKIDGRYLPWSLITKLSELKSREGQRRIRD